ncbi:GGDEF domain-containing protein [Thermosipho melanesiensis]|uniref:Diguanylate cyclase n=2 Tax=Thermosipho melanesiensis TaxID=46541 RepID=A6LKN4_THEM4|nr:GGDEF domain-containing protein [Thermosipho melanesiensis]ABR30485.1 diguanylate cyclase [Thermosipho melanesiensis BI429]APT74837.1 hypothetical protein BW47_03350 [Thermosipho melanesiensis]
MLKGKFNNVGYDTLVFSRVSGNIIKVYLNNELIYKFGSETANIWNKTFKIELEKLKDENYLTIEIFGIYDVGLSSKPFLTTKENARKYVFYKEFFKEKFIYISIGISIISAIVSWIFGTAIRDIQLRYSYISFGIFFMLTAFFLLHFGVRETTFSLNLYFAFLKLLSLASYSSLVFCIYAVETYKNNKFTSRWIVIVFITFLILVSISFDFTIYVKVTQITNVFMIFALVYTVIRVFALKVEYLYFSSVFSAIVVIESIVSLFVPNTKELLTSYAFTVSAISVIVMLSKDFEKLVLEHRFLSNEILKDPLTNAFNRNIIDRLKPGGYFILIDLNDFKLLNDKYGHGYGDKILKSFSEIVEGNLSTNDYFIRLGGDEFAIVTHLEDPKGLIENIRKKVKEKINLDFSYGISRYVQFEKTYKKADEKLYKMKQQKALKYKK